MLKIFILVNKLSKYLFSKRYLKIIIEYLHVKYLFDCYIYIYITDGMYSYGICKKRPYIYIYLLEK